MTGDDYKGKTRNHIVARVSPIINKMLKCCLHPRKVKCEVNLCRQVKARQTLSFLTLES